MANSERTERATTSGVTASGAADNTERMATKPASGTTTISTAPTAPSLSTLSADPEDLEFYLAVEVHYHRSRQSWLATAHRWMMFLAILFGTAAAAQVIPPLFAGFLAAAAAAADLCFDFTQRATQHSDLARRYLVMARELAGGREDEILCKKILSDFVDISGDEPPVYNAAKDIAHNLAIQSLGRDLATRAIIPSNKRLWAHVCRFESV